MSASFLDQHAIPDSFDSEVNHHCTRKDISDNSNKTFQDIVVVQQLNKARFPVYLISSKVDNQIYAMKVFPYQNGQPHPSYINELRFSNLKHPNLIRTFYLQHERKTVSEIGTLLVVSYKIMEYAPYGDLFDFVTKNRHLLDEKLARTFFKQLIDGLEYLHSIGVSHMDIKLENLLIGQDYTLKITDFDLSYIENDDAVIGKGTKFYRAPEVAQGKCRNTKAADIYSAGIILFALKCQGLLPHSENNFVNGVNFSQLLMSHESKFWKEHSKVQGREESFFDKDFKELFVAMTHCNPEKRASIESIKKSKWYNGPCYSSEEFREIMMKAREN